MQFTKIFAYILVLFIVFGCGASSQELVEKARLAMKEQKFEEAILLLNKAIDRNAQNADAFNARGVALFELGKYNDAMLDYKQAIELAPKNYRPYFNRAELYRSSTTSRLLNLPLKITALTSIVPSCTETSNNGTKPYKTTTKPSPWLPK